MTGELFSFDLWGRTFTIYFYGVFLLMSVVVGILILYRELSRRELKTKRILDNIFWILLFGIVGARLGYVLLHLDFYARNPSEIFLIWQGGLNFTGGLIFGFVAAFVWLYLKKRKELYYWLDSLMLAVMLSHAIGMLGSFTSGLDYGKETSLPWGVKVSGLNDGILRHPTQIYEFLAYLGGFIILLFLSNRAVIRGKESNIFPGLIFYAGVTITFLVRFLVEFVRVSDNILFNIGRYDITITHITSLIIILVALIILAIKERKYLKSK